MRATQMSATVFQSQHPGVYEWLAAKKDSFEFAGSLFRAILKYGSLTEKQLAAAIRCMEKDSPKVKEVAKAVAPDVATDKLMAAFNAASASGLKRPKLRFEGFEATLAPKSGKNPGAVYVKNGVTYLGKVQDGKFFAARDCMTDVAEAVSEAMGDPLAAAIAYGKAHGACSCCGRLLTDPVSVSRGIGPICAERFGL